MIINLQEGKFFREGKIYSSLFKSDMPILIENEAEVSYAEKCVDHLNNMSEELKESICRALLEFCLENIDNREGFPVPVSYSTEPKDILRCVVPKRFTVTEPVDADVIAWQMECEAEHEPDHAIEIDVRDGKLVYLGCYFNGSPWKDYSGDISNYAVKL